VAGRPIGVFYRVGKNRRGGQDGGVPDRCKSAIQFVEGAKRAKNILGQAHAGISTDPREKRVVQGAGQLLRGTGSGCSGGRSQNAEKYRKLDMGGDVTGGGEMRKRGDSVRHLIKKQRIIFLERIWHHHPSKKTCAQSKPEKRRLPHYANRLQASGRDLSGDGQAAEAEGLYLRSVKSGRGRANGFG